VRVHSNYTNIAGHVPAKETELSTDKTASYKLTLKADSGYKGEQTGRISPEQYGAACHILGGNVLPEVAQIEWLQKANTLHRQVDILYVVVGYQVTVTWDENPISEAFEGETVSEAISKAMAGFDLDAHPPFQARDIHGHERQMNALATQRDELMADLQEAASTLRRYETLHRAKGTDESNAKADVNAGLAARFEATIAKAK
jgi:hypothetical protein